MIRRSPFLSRAAALCSLVGGLACAPAVHARDWELPAGCKHEVTGNEFDDEPVVEYYAGGELQDGSLTVGNVAWSQGAGSVQVYVTPNPKALYLLVVTYTPFLVGAVAILPTRDKLGTYPLPPAGSSTNPQEKTVFDTFTVSINDQSGQPMPNASVMWSPQYSGADPFITTTDENGQMVLGCVQNLAAGFQVYVVSADGKNEFATTVKVKSVKQVEPGVFAAIAADY